MQLQRAAPPTKSSLILRAQIRGTVGYRVPLCIYYRKLIVYAVILTGIHQNRKYVYLWAFVQANYRSRDAFGPPLDWAGPLTIM